MKQNKNAAIMRSIGATIRGDLSMPVSVRTPIVAEKNMGVIPIVGNTLSVFRPNARRIEMPSRDASIVTMRN